MVTEAPPRLVTADDLLELSSDGFYGELIRGELCEQMPPGVLHAWIVARIAGLLYVHLVDKVIGTVLAGDHGVLVERDPDTVRAPDVAFYSAETMPLNPVVSGYTDLVPDLVVEVRSPNDSRADVHDKAMMWLSIGVKIVWVVLPETRRVDVYRPGAETATLSGTESLVGDNVLPEFVCSIGDMFPALESDTE